MVGNFKSKLYLLVDGLRLEPDGVEEEVVSLDGGHALRVRLVALADLAVLLFLKEIQKYCHLNLKYLIKIQFMVMLNLASSSGCCAMLSRYLQRVSAQTCARSSLDMVLQGGHSMAIIHVS